MSAKNYWLAFGIGVSAGAAIALLYAPQSGARTRKQLRKGLDNAVDDANDYLKDAGDYLKAQAEKLSDEAEVAVKRARKFADKAGDHISDIADNVSDVYGSAVKSAKSLV